MFEKIQESLSRFWNNNSKFLLPYILLPLFGIYLIDYVVMLSHVLKFVLFTIVITSIVALIAGIVMALMDFANNGEYKKFLKTNLCDKFPLFEVGYKLGEWALKDKEDE